MGDVEYKGRGKEQRKFMDVMKDTTRMVGVTEEDASDSVRWR